MLNYKLERFSETLCLQLCALRSFTNVPLKEFLFVFFA
jgi:hypothetical protein